MGLLKRVFGSAGRSDPLQRAEELATAGDYRAAIALLQDACEGDSDGRLAQRLVDMRIEAFEKLTWPAPDVTWPPAHDDRFSAVSGFPEIDASALDAGALKAGILGKGGLIVRGLMQPTLVEEMRERVHLALVARRDQVIGGPDAALAPWFNRSPRVRGGPVQFGKDDSNRYSESGSVWGVDSPLTAAALTGFYHDIGLPGMLHDYFQEAAVLSVRKWVLRCVEPNNNEKAGWHQDGRFLGNPAIRTVNLWIALTDCGTGMKAPGIELVGENEGEIYATGTAGADFDWTVSQTLVDEIARTHPVETPTFAAGDAIFFDHFNLHRTAFGTDHSENRYALESWFFAASTAPHKQQPVVL
ncbi:MAG: hypothetical protein Hals2KO_37870 [Halioglobus sp.]